MAYFLRPAIGAITNIRGIFWAPGEVQKSKGDEAYSGELNELLGFNNSSSNNLQGIKRNYSLWAAHGIIVSGQYRHSVTCQSSLKGIHKSCFLFQFSEIIPLLSSKGKKWAIWNSYFLKGWISIDPIHDHKQCSVWLHSYTHLKGVVIWTIYCIE